MERPFTIDHMNHIVLRVRDLQKSLAFYEMLGGDAPRTVAAGMRVGVGAGGQSIILQERKDYQPAEVGAVDHVNLMIHAADINQVAAYLRENGADIASVEESRAGPTVNVRDPDGYMLEIRILRQAS